LSGLCPGVLAIRQDLHTVDEHVHYAFSVSMRLSERCAILDTRRIEDHDVGVTVNG
jgi:hypothetical protein